MTMRNIILLTFMLVAMAATAQGNKEDKFYTIREEMESLPETKNWQVKKNHHTLMSGYWFRYILNEKERSIEGFMPEKLRSLLNAFNATEEYASETIYGRENNKDQNDEDRFIKFIRPDSHFQDGVVFGYKLSNNYKYTCLQRYGNEYNRYLIKWWRNSFVDSDGKPFDSIDGYIYEMRGDQWKKYDWLRKKSSDINHKKVSGNSVDTTEYVKTREKLIFLRNHLNANINNAKEVSGVAFLTKELCENLKQATTALQHKKLVDIVTDMRKKAEEPKSKKMFHHAVKLLEKLAVRSFNYKRMKVRGTYHRSYSGDLVKEEYCKDRNEHYEINLNDSNLTDWHLKGVTPSTAPFIKMTLDHNLWSQRYSYKYENGEISFLKSLPQGSVVEVSNGSGGDEWMLFVDSVPVYVNMKTGDIVASDINERFIEYQKRMKVIVGDRSKYAIGEDHSTELILDEEGFDELRKKLKDFNLSTIKANRGNRIAEYIISNEYLGMTFEELHDIMQEPAYRNSSITQNAYSYYKEKARRQPGQTYYDVMLEDNEGNMRSLSEYVGKSKYVVVHFWSPNSWWSRRNMRANKNIADDYDDKDIKVIGIAVIKEKDKDKLKEDWRSYTKSRKMHWTQMVTSFNSDVTEKYGISALPETIIIDADGKIVAEGLHDNSLKQKVAELLGN